MLVPHECHIVIHTDLWLKCYVTHPLTLSVFRRFGRISKSDYQLMFVHPPVCMEQLVSRWTNFH